jgi:mannose-6-phosphate isomerase
VSVCPLLFDPIYKPRLWGGRRLSDVLGREVPDTGPIGESWEVADLESDQSVARGPDAVAGRTLGEIVRAWGADLLGEAPLFGGRFPLLIKYLDARKDLSVQVHPDDATARALGGGVRVKHEAWYIVAADRDACIFRGLRPGVDRDGLRDAIRRDRVVELLHRVPVAAGECYYVPSGTLHALGAGVLVAEIQTPSDVTYRVYDWGRADPATGRPRDLHIEEALGCITLGPQSFPQEVRTEVAGVWTSATRLIACESFVVDRAGAPAGLDRPIPHAEIAIWMVLEGRGRIRWGRDGHDATLAFRGGDTLVLPAGLGPAQLVTEEDCVWLNVTVPKGKGDAGPTG